MATSGMPISHTDNGTPKNAYGKPPPPKKKQDKVILLSDQEKQQYGNRCPAGYKKINLLGKGGIALVWLGEDIQTGQQVAMK